MVNTRYKLQTTKLTSVRAVSPVFGMRAFNSLIWRMSSSVELTAFWMRLRTAPLHAFELGSWLAIQHAAHGAEFAGDVTIAPEDGGQIDVAAAIQILEAGMMRATSAARVATPAESVFNLE